MSIRLKFQPKGLGNKDDDYYLAEKLNKCVVCGSDKEYMRHSIVPHAYRKYFDLKYKSRSSHDIGILFLFLFIFLMWDKNYKNKIK